MATEAQVLAIADTILEEFNGDIALWRAHLKRSRLVTELWRLESERNNMVAAEDAQNQAYLAQLVVKNDEIAAKQAEIDAL